MKEAGDTEEAEVYSGKNLNTYNHRETIVQPTRFFELDRWGNVLKEMNSLGYVIDREYDDSNHLIKLMLPTIDISSSNNAPTSNKIRPTTQEFYNVLGFKVAEKTPNSYIKKWIVNEVGKPLAIILGDGTYASRDVYDALLRTAYWADTRGNLWKNTFNQTSHLTERLSPEGRKQTYDHDEKDNVRQEKDGGWFLNQENVHYYGHDVQGNVEVHFMPNGTQVKIEFDRNGVMTHIGTPEGNRDWTADYFGNINSHTDLGGFFYEYKRDGKKQLISEMALNGDGLAYTLKLIAINFHQKKLTLKDGLPWIIETKRFFTTGIFKNGRKHQTYEYDAGRLIKITDHALQKVMTYQYDTEDRIRAVRVTDMAGNLIREYRITYNEAGFEVEHFDTNILVKMKYDLNGNRKEVTAQIGDKVIAVQSNAFDGADRVTKEGDAFYTYQDNLRATETRDGQLCKVLHDRDGLFTEKRNAVDVQLLLRQHDTGGRLSSVRELKTDDGFYYTDGVFAYDQNNRPSFQNSMRVGKDEVDYATTFAYTDEKSMESPSRQDTDYPEGEMHEKMTFTHMKAETPLLIQVNGKRSAPKSDSTHSSATRYYDANQMVSGELGAENEETQKPETVVIDTAPDRILSKTIISTPKHDKFLSTTKQTVPYYTVNGQALGMLKRKIKPRIYPAFLPPPPEDDALAYEILLGHAVTGRGGSAIAVQMKEKELLRAFKRLMGGKKLERFFKHAGRGPSFELSRLIQATSVSYPPPMPTRVMAQRGDTYESIADRFGMKGEGERISQIANPMPEPTPGMEVVLLQYETSHNRAGDYVPYYQFMNTLIGTLRPHMTMPQPHEESGGILDNDR